MKKSIAVIGAGPAGLMAAECLARSGHAVTIYEAMPSAARKFLMAGRGGLNLTHSEPLDAFLKRYADADPRILNAIGAFTPEHLRAWAENLGHGTFIGSSGRVFPKAMKASPLLRSWLKLLRDLGVTSALRHRWTGWGKDGALLIDHAEGLSEIRPDASVLALGGASWPRLGSDGAWQSLFAKAGISIRPLSPSNVGVRIGWSEVFRQRFGGEPLKRIAVSLGETTRRGEAVITQDGIEGGAIYALSAEIRSALSAGAGGTALLFIDLRPDLSAEALAAKLCKPRGAQSWSTYLRKTAGLSPVSIGLLREGGSFDGTALELAHRIKSVAMTITGLMPIDRAISSAGGVLTETLDDRFMLRDRPGTFLCGEMLDWDAPTGGYLLQACFATAVAAAAGVDSWLKSSLR